MYRVTLFFLLLFVVGVCPHEEHSHEAPHFKYSREANTQLPKPSGAHVVTHNLRTEAPQQLWLETAGAIALISIAPFLLLIIIPDLNKYHGLLKILLAFAAGGLLGDAFLHLIPHAIDSGDHHHHHDHEEADSHDHHHHEHEHEHEHDHSRHLMVGLSVVAGIFIFLCIEKMIRLLQNGNSHGHSHAAPAEGNKQTNKKNKNKNPAAGGDTQVKEAKKPVAKSGGKVSEFKVAGYLNLAADFTHNFTDGLAIGASFLISRNVGMVTTVTVLLHELPHEIGDYAILIRSGCSARKAMFLQLLTAIGAALGAFLSLAAAGVGMEHLGLKFDVPLLSEDFITGCILPFTAGGFIYIAMTSVLPDLLSTDPVLSKQGFFARMVQSVTEVLAMVGGIGMMAALGSME